ncbi:MAG: hypothetical protein KC983_09905, partial [Phycisphaerales bacterium]|nr:hypothetical protein [Phycisphaerales bacterium]
PVMCAASYDDAAPAGCTTVTVPAMVEARDAADATFLPFLRDDVDSLAAPGCVASPAGYETLLSIRTMIEPTACITAGMIDRTTPAGRSTVMDSAAVLGRAWIAEQIEHGMVLLHAVRALAVREDDLTAVGPAVHATPTATALFSVRRDLRPAPACALPPMTSIAALASIMTASPSPDRHAIAGASSSSPVLVNRVMTAGLVDDAPILAYIGLTYLAGVLSIPFGCSIVSRRLAPTGESPASVRLRRTLLPRRVRARPSLADETARLQDADALVVT